MIGIVVAVTLFEKFVMAYFIGRTIGIKLEDAKRLNRVGKIAVASIAAGLPTMAIYWLTRDFPPIINLFLSCVVFAPVYLGVIYLLGTITEEEKQEIQGMLRKFNRFAKPKNEVIEPLPLEMNPKSEA